MSRLRSSFESYREIGRRFGFLAMLQHLMHRLVNRLIYYERLNIIVLERDELKPFKERRPGKLTTETATREMLEEIKPNDEWALFDWHMERLSRGDVCLLSYVDGTLAGYTWVHTAGCPELFSNLVISVPPEYLYNYAGYTHPDFRGYGLQSYRHHAVLSNPQWQFANGILGFVHHSNFASRRGQAKSGFKTIGTIRLIGSRDRFLALFSRNLRALGIKRIESSLQKSPRSA